MHPSNPCNPWLRLAVVASILLGSLCWLTFLVRAAPFSSSSSSQLKFPSDLYELRDVAVALSSLTSSSTSYALLLFSSAYLFKQSFAVPGSALLNALAGAAFGLPGGLALCSILTAVGASCCCLMAR